MSAGGRGSRCVVEERTDVVNLNPWITNLLDPVWQPSTRNARISVKKYALFPKRWQKVNNFVQYSVLKQEEDAAEKWKSDLHSGERN